MSIRFVLFSFGISVLFLIGCKPKTPTPREGLHVPQWAKQVVWYQIFPERFQNGDLSNDPQVEDLKGSWPHDPVAQWHSSPWTGDWYTLQPWEQDNRGFYYHAQRRRYGGDLQGVLDRLDYLSDLGINAIYFNPLFESPSLHKYDGASYHHIDDNFGPRPLANRARLHQEIPDRPETWIWTSADSLFLCLVKECHRRGMRVIMDGVWNHVGLNFWAFRDVVDKQENSPFKNWFFIKQWDDPRTPRNEFEYQGWAGVREMPEIREDENGFFPPARDYIFQSVKRWMDPDGDGDPSDGIDGWRLDVAEKVTFASWRAFHVWVRSINPEAYLVGEVWWEKWPEKMYDPTPWLKGDVFDAVMNYRWASAVQRFFIDRARRIPPTQFDRLLGMLRNENPIEVNAVLFNLVDSHDTDRLASMIVNPDRPYNAENRVADNRGYDIRKPDAEEIQIQKLIAVFQMTYLGAPVLYYGDEAGMWGAADPDERKPMLWADLNYEDEVSHPFLQERPRDPNRFDKDLFTFYKKLIAIRLHHPCLTLGDFQLVQADDANNVYAFGRILGKDTIFVVLNNSKETRDVSFAADGAVWTELLDGGTQTVENGCLRVTMPPKSGKLFERTRSR